KQRTAEDERDEDKLDRRWHSAECRRHEHAGRGIRHGDGHRERYRSGRDGGEETERGEGITCAGEQGPPDDALLKGRELAEGPEPEGDQSEADGSHGGGDLDRPDGAAHLTGR